MNREKQRLSRRSRLNRVVAILVSATVAAGLTGIVLARWSRPEVRRPGETLDDITSRLAKSLPAEAALPSFRSVTSEAGLSGFRTFEGARSSQLPEDMGSGAAWGDYDNDGDDDLFLVSAGGALDRPPTELARCELYENLGDGSFRRAAFPDLRIQGMAAAWGDYDGDGRLDLVVTGFDQLLLFHNDGDGFSRSGALGERRGYWAGAVWGDYDNDRDLDLYVTGYLRYVNDPTKRRRHTERYGSAVPYTLNPASYEAERNLLFENDGAGGFAEVAETLGVSNPEGRSLGAIFHDLNDDGWLDLYVANDISDNVLYLNREGRFEDVSLAAWVADYRGAMGLAAGDWNRDGDDDLFVTHWIAQENALFDSLLRVGPMSSEGGVSPSADGRAPAGDSTGHRAQLGFTDRAAALGLGQIALQVIGWGTEFGDFDSDGWLDLAVANGSTFETDEEPRKLEPQLPFLLWNEKGEFFHDLAPLVDDLSVPRVGRGLALSDYDADGDLDILLVDHAAGVELFRNEGSQGRWIGLRLRSRTASGQTIGFGDGATVVATVGEVEMRRSVTGSSYLSQSSRTLHFGLGDAAKVDRLEVRWLGGEPQIFTDLEAGFAWELREGNPEATRLSSGGRSDRDLASVSKPEDFWTTQRAAMDAMKREGDLPKAVALFRQALELRPGHEDSLYYLANCLASLGRPQEAMAELDRLRSRNPRSHRAHRQWGILRSMEATSFEDLEAAERVLDVALKLNPEETGTLQVLGEIALMKGDLELAAQRLEWVTRSNPQAEGAFFLRAYMSWLNGDEDSTARLLDSALSARGDEWKPQGAVAEGDVAARMHHDETPLARFWTDSSGSNVQERFAALGRYVGTLRSRQAAP